MYFLGVGFLSGAIVHYPVNPGLYGIIEAVGAIIFTIASTLNEWITNKRHLLQEGVIKIVFYSLVLSIGLGMISGGIQHFVDFPVYASSLIPLGIIVSLIGFVLSKEIKLDTRHRLILIAKLSLITIPLFLVLNTWAKSMPQSTDAHGHGTSTNNEQAVDTHMEERTIQMDHAEVKDDKQFINEMIPHNQEAVDTSEYLSDRTSKQELKQFTRAVINVQTKEINQMKQWYKSWFNKEYETNTDYVPMMGNLTQFQGEELEKEYIKGMIAHHEGAITMAKQILPIAQKSEIKKMAEDIVKVQSEKIIMLQNMLENYDHEESEHI